MPIRGRNDIIKIIGVGLSIEGEDENPCSPMGHKRGTRIKEIEMDNSFESKNSDHVVGITLKEYATLQGAVAFGDLEAIVQWVKEKPDDLNRPDVLGYTPLESAVRTESIKGVRKLIELGADVNQKNGMGTTPLHHAAATGNVAVMTLLIGAGANPHAQTQATYCKREVFHYALHSGNLEAVNYMLAQGINVNAKDEKKWGYLERAVKWGFFAAVKPLLEHEIKSQQIEKVLQQLSERPDAKANHLIPMLEGHLLAQQEKKILQKSCRPVKRKKESSSTPSKKSAHRI